MSAGFALSLALLSAPLQGADEPVFEEHRLEERVLHQGFDRPLELAVLPDGRVLVIELTGKLWMYRPDRAELSLAFEIKVFTEQENGLIGLTLDPAEKMMLGSVPAAQLEAIIARTHVPDRDRRAFLGKVAAVMLATMGLAAPACVETADKGIRPDDPKRDGRRDRFEPTTGSAPDPPPEPETPNEGETYAGIRPDVPPPPEPERRAEP